MTRLQARISSLERAAERQHHILPLPPLFTHSPETTADLDPTYLHNPPMALPIPPHLTHPLSPAPTLTLPLPPALTEPLLPNQTQAWSSIDSSLDLPPSLKATLREVLCKQSWESSFSSSPSLPSLQDSVDQSMRGLGAADATAASDCSFNPLTYKVDPAEDTTLDLEAPTHQEGARESRRGSVCTLVGEEEEEEEEERDKDTLTGMLRFVNQTLAMQEDPFLWSSSGQSGTGSTLPPQVRAEPLFDPPVVGRNGARKKLKNNRLKGFSMKIFHHPSLSYETQGMCYFLWCDNLSTHSKCNLCSYKPIM